MGKLKNFAVVSALAAAVCLAPIVLFVVLYAGLLLSLVVPDRFIDSGVEYFEGEKREQARYFLSETEFLLNEIALLPEPLRVESVKKCPPDAKPGDEIDGPKPGRVRLPYSVDVRRYGPFGIPLKPIEWRCDGTAHWGDRVMMQ